MSIAYTSLLALGQPATGTESGTWGDDVNNAITAYVDIAIAGTLSFSGDGAVSLANTFGTSIATNIGASTAQYMVLRFTGTLSTTKVITAPSASKLYLVDNATSGGFGVTVKASGQTGYTVAASTKAWVYYNGTDYVLASTNDVSKLTGTLAATQGGTGQSSYAVGDILYASSTTALSKLTIAAAGNVLRSGTTPAWGKVDLTTDVTGTLPVANGGTGAATYTANNVLLGNGTSAFQTVAPGTAGNVLTSVGGTWASAALPASYTGPRVSVHVSSSTFTPPAGITTLKITAIGGGGGGGGPNSGYGGPNPAYAGNGGACVAVVTVTPLTTYTVTVGAGGLGSNSNFGTATGGNGDPGGETWFGVNAGSKLVSSTGGTGSTVTWSTIGSGCCVSNVTTTANGTTGTSTVTGTVIRQQNSTWAAPTQFTLGYIIFGGTVISTTNTTSRIVWSVTSEYAPGGGGRGASYFSTTTASGGIGGMMLIEY